MKLELVPKLAQQQTLSPKLMVSMRMLPLTTTELELQIERELEENPALELAPQNGDAPADLPQNDALAGKLRLFQPFQDAGGRRRPDADEGEDFFAGTAAHEGGLAAHLIEQLWMMELAPEVRGATEEIIGNLDWRGLLVAPIEELRAQFPFYLSESFDAGLKVVRGLDPAGVGAESLLDCLLLQCERLQEPHELAERILREKFALLLHNRLPQLAEETGATLAEVKEAVEVIGRFSPHPGAAFAPENARAITPDVVVDEGTHGYRVRVVDEGVPRLQLSEQCRELLRREDLAPEVAQYLKKKIESAQWLMQALDGRRKTLQHIAETVLEFQSAFMTQGPSHVRPLNMRTIAEAVGVHISTVSRAIKGKYIQTPWGMFPLRSFFEGGVESNEGERASKSSLKERIAEMISREERQQPLSDGEIASKLRAQGFTISRRTVSKYRTSASIPPANLRKEFVA